MRGPGSVSCPTCGCRETAPAAAAALDVLPPPIAAALALIPTLTARELETFELLGLGYDNRSIAKVLAIGERTAKRHITAILAKLQLESRLQAGLTAMLVKFDPGGAASRGRRVIDGASELWWGSSGAAGRRDSVSNRAPGNLICVASGESVGVIG